MRSEASPPALRPIVVGRILLYADDLVGRWLSDHMGVEILPPFTSFGVIGANGQLTGAMIFNNLNEGSVEVSLYAPRAITKGLLRVASSYIFETLGCNRVTARTRASNLRACRFIQKVGFQREGVLRAYYKDGEDAILYGLTKSDNRW